MAGLSSITPAADFGTGLTVAAYSAQVNAFSTKLDTYNQMVTAVDELQNQIDADEAALREMNARMLAAAEAHYGPDSNQYEQAGGTRRRDRKTPAKKGGEKTTVEKTV
jgi:hypothetical protein